MPWVKGQSGNLKGRKKNENSPRSRLEKALATEGKKLETTFLEVVAQDAFVDKDMKLAVLKMLIPTLKATEVDLSIGKNNTLSIVLYNEKKHSKSKV